MRDPNSMKINFMKAIIRKCLQSENCYSEVNVEKVFKKLTSGGKDLSGAVVSSEPLIKEQQRIAILGALDGEE